MTPATLHRWIPILLAAGQYRLAEELRKELSALETRKEAA